MSEFPRWRSVDRQYTKIWRRKMWFSTKIERRKNLKKNTQKFEEEKWSFTQVNVRGLG